MSLYCTFFPLLPAKKSYLLFYFFSSNYSALAKNVKLPVLVWAKNWSLNIFGSQLNHENFGLDSQFSKCLLNEYYVQTTVCSLGKHQTSLLELTLQ